MIRARDKRQPNVKSLVRDDDVDGLIAAAAYTEVVSSPEGARIDLGAAIREEAVLALRQVALERAGKTFAAALADSSDRVRCAGVAALYERGDADQLAEAVAGIPATAGRARAMAVRALFELHAPGSSCRLADALVHRQDNLPLNEEDEALVPALLRIEERPEAPAEVVQVLISALVHTSEVVTERAEALLVRLSPASTDALLRELAEGPAAHRAAAVLGDLKDPRALQPLVAALSHPDPRVRSQSCFALGELRDPVAIEPLLQATRDPEHEVRVIASTALNGMGTVALAVSVAALLRPTLASAPARDSALGRRSTAKAAEGGASPAAIPADESPPVELRRRGQRLR